MSISLFTPTTPHPCPQLAATAAGPGAKPLQLPFPSPLHFQPQSLHCVPAVRPTPTRHVAALCAKKATQGMKEQKWIHEGVIVESLPNVMFRVQLDNNDVILGYTSGKMKKNNIKMFPGDKVKIEVSRYDSTRGRIVYRLQNKNSDQ